MKKFMTTISVLIAVTLLILMTGCGPKADYTSFVQCLTEANMTMYGASWCPHCQNVKKEFGTAMTYVKYVECDANTPGAEPEKCAAAKVEYLPTFQFNDGTTLFGEVKFEILAEKTKCALP